MCRKFNSALLCLRDKQCQWQLAKFCIRGLGFMARLLHVLLVIEVIYGQVPVVL